MAALDAADDCVDHPRDRPAAQDDAGGDHEHGRAAVPLHIQAADQPAKAGAGSDEEGGEDGLHRGVEVGRGDALAVDDAGAPAGRKGDACGSVR